MRKETVCSAGSRAVCLVDGAPAKPAAFRRTDNARIACGGGRGPAPSAVP